MEITIIKAASPNEVSESERLVRREEECIQNIIIVARTTDELIPVSSIKQNEKARMKPEKVRLLILNSLQKAESKRTI